MIIPLMYLLIYVLVVVLFAVVLLWAMDQLGVPEPIRTVLRVIVIVICLCIIIMLMLDILGGARLLLPVR
jgi:preprotein translocase subunit SecE